ncbi:hypothetical protein [Jeotgalibacillus sp. R-1-5s-1]|uniref:hypothetical protein n=1 Tax=Jeotgalibacillus sp. R-1-5s-1 TaxID=2555897 RepID=UPI00106A525E|nr:hypothetical protein [Jeotgalibacillus sp. R-1-5s-1]TFD97066.1 hypothetical protein E2491_10260 [Jeotgalibacillus sp. R-1-5s-1]
MDQQGVVLQFPALKIHSEEYEVMMEAEVICDSGMDRESESIRDGLDEVNEALRSNQSHLDRVNQEIDRLTNHADQLDNMIAVGSGILAGFIDVFWVGEFNFKRGEAWSNEKVNRFVEGVARSKGWKGKNDLKGAISFLEKEFKIPSDSIYSGNAKNITHKSHRLDDLAHHPTLLGLFASILTQFTKKGYFQDRNGEFLSIPVPISIDPKDKTLIGHDLLSKISCGTINWFFHLVSDMSGSNKTAGAGMGIPGPFISLLKEISLIPGISDSGLPQKLYDAFVKQKFDFRSELAVGHEISRQAMPVILNEVIVRSFYLIRRLFLELRESDVESLNWDKILPYKNRTIVRMLTIATGTFTLIDISDAAIRGGIKSGGQAPLFAKEFLLHLNVVGVGRFTVAVSTDVIYGVKKNQNRDERIVLMNERLHLLNAKAFYMEAGMWQAAKQTDRSISEAIMKMQEAKVVSIKAWEANAHSMKQIEKYQDEIEKHNPGLIDEIDDLLKWG